MAIRPGKHVKSTIRTRFRRGLVVSIVTAGAVLGAAVPAAQAGICPAPGTYSLSDRGPLLDVQYGGNTGYTEYTFDIDGRRETWRDDISAPQGPTMSRTRCGPTPPPALTPPPAPPANDGGGGGGGQPASGGSSGGVWSLPSFPREGVVTVGELDPV